MSLICHYFIFKMIGSTSLSGVNSSTFDADYKASLEGSMEDFLNDGTGGGATVRITGTEDSPEAGKMAGKGSDSDNDKGTGNLRRVLLPGFTLVIFYDVVIHLEQYGVEPESVYGVVDQILINAQQSSALTNKMNELLVELKGSETSVITVEELVNDEESVVITVLKTAVPSLQPTVAPSSSSSSSSNSNEDSLMLIIIIAVLVVVVLVACACGAYYLFVYSKQRNVSPGTIAAAAAAKANPPPSSVLPSAPFYDAQTEQPYAQAEQPVAIADVHNDSAGATTAVAQAHKKEIELGVVDSQQL
jgi:flagellar basal body-associated protein FliL